MSKLFQLNFKLDHNSIKLVQSLFGLGQCVRMFVLLFQFSAMVPSFVEKSKFAPGYLEKQGLSKTDGLILYKRGENYTTDFNLRQAVFVNLFSPIFTRSIPWNFSGFEVYKK